MEYIQSCKELQWFRVSMRIIMHGEHGIIKTESKHIIKYVQQEFNPITRIVEAAYD